MSVFDARTPPDRDREALQSSGLRDREAQVNSNSRPGTKPPSQYERCKKFLERGWCCGLLFLDPPDNGPPILRYTGRIHELRKDGWLIDRRECEHPWHDHRHSTMWEWKIVGHANDGKMPGFGDV